VPHRFSLLCFSSPQPPHTFFIRFSGDPAFRQHFIQLALGTVRRITKAAGLGYTQSSFPNHAV
jgi:hypothetical protein